MNKQFFRAWHRRIGIVSLFMVLWLAFSGVLINHGDSLSLNKSKINFSWLNQLYGLDQSIEMPPAFLINDNYLFCFQEKLYLNTEALSACDSSLTMALLVNDEVDTIENEIHGVFLSEQALLVFDENFVILDRIDYSIIGKQVEDILLLDGQFVFKEKGKSIFWYLDLQNLNVLPIKGLPEGEIRKSLYPLANLPLDIFHELSFPGISLERILLDAHSGRLFGSLGVLVVDFFAFAFVLLGLSGLWIFFRKPR